ncbi:MAG: F0F1 ATP synthase subunit A [Deltaproteobacteria bacterium]|nr:F0F1 ATP synthase subunit A [Deltaproteobacteria bacterium]
MSAREVGDMITDHLQDTPSLFGHAIHLPGPFLSFDILGIHVEIGLTQNVVMMLMAAFLLIIMGILVRRRIALVPKGIGNLVEAFVLFIRDEIAAATMPAREAFRYTSFLCTTFFFILVCNLLGLIPYGATATGNLAVTASLAFAAFLMIQYAGMRKMGVLGYFRHLVPPGVPWWLAPLMVVVELMGVFAKPFALCVRLFANMLAGHAVILSLIGLIFLVGWLMVVPSVAFGVFIYCLEIFVAFLQAYIFTMLTSVFIGLLVADTH